MDDRPVLLAERLHPVIGDHAARIGVVGPEPEHPWIAHLGQRRIGAAETDRFAGPQYVRRHRVILRRADRAEERDDVGLRGEFGEGEHRAGIGRLVVLGDEFDLSSRTPPDLFTRSRAILAPVSAYLPLSAAGPVTGSTMPILIVSPWRERRGRTPAPRARGEPQVYGPSGEPHAFLRDIALSDWFRRTFAYRWPSVSLKLAEFGRPLQASPLRRAAAMRLAGGDALELEKFANASHLGRRQKGAIRGMSVRSSGSRAQRTSRIASSAPVNDGTAGSKGETDMVNSHGRFVWYELMTTDMESAKAFYANVVGWRRARRLDARSGL